MERKRLDANDLEAVKAAHETLMSSSARLWDDLSPTQSRDELAKRLDMKGLVVVALVRYLVASHTERQLRELRAVYVRMRHAAALPVFATQKGQAWLREAVTDVSAFVETLPRRDWQLNVVLAGLPLIPGSAIAWLFAQQWVPEYHFWSYVRMLVGFALGAAFGVAFAAVHGSFQVKRRLLGAPVVGQRERENIYGREDVLFAMLGWPKRTELPVDFILSIATQVVGAGVCVGTAINGFRHGFVGGGILFLAIAAVLPLTAARSARRAKERRPH